MVADPGFLDVHALSGAYALDALDDLERAAFERHQRACPSCAQEAAELTVTAARLADGTASEPPGGLRDRVLAGIAGTAQVGPYPAVARPPRQRGAARGRVAATGGWRRWAAGVAAAVVLLAGAGGVVLAERRLGDAHRVQARADRITAVLAAPDAVVHTVAGPDGDGRVTLVVSQARDEAVAVLGGLRSPGTGRTYQLWLIDDGGAADAGTLGTGATGGTLLLDGVHGKRTFTMTREPAGGSRRPTTTPLSPITLT